MPGKGGRIDSANINQAVVVGAPDPPVKKATTKKTAATSSPAPLESSAQEGPAADDIKGSDK